MNYPENQQQDWGSGGGYYWQQGYLQDDVDLFAPRGSRALAVLSAVLGLGLAGVLAWQTLDLMAELGDVEGLAGIWNIAHLAVAGIVLIGAVLVFARLIAGAFILSVGALIALAGLLLAPLAVPDITPLMAGPSSTGFGGSGSRRSGYGDYFKAVFEFSNELAILQLVGVVLAFLVMIIAVLPPSRDSLRRRRLDDSAPQADW